MEHALCAIPDPAFDPKPWLPHYLMANVLVLPCLAPMDPQLQSHPPGHQTTLFQRQPPVPSSPKRSPKTHHRLPQQIWNRRRCRLRRPQNVRAPPAPLYLFSTGSKKYTYPPKPNSSYLPNTKGRWTHHREPLPHRWKTFPPSNWKSFTDENFKAEDYFCVDLRGGLGEVGRQSLTFIKLG